MTKTDSQRNRKRHDGKRRENPINKGNSWIERLKLKMRLTRIMRIKAIFPAQI